MTKLTKHQAQNMVELYSHAGNYDGEIHKNFIFIRFYLLDGSVVHHAIEPDPKGKPFKWKSVPKGPKDIAVNFDFSLHGNTNTERHAPLSKLFWVKLPGRELSPIFNSEGQFTFIRHMLPSGLSRLIQIGNYIDNYQPKVGDFIDLGPGNTYSICEVFTVEEFIKHRQEIEYGEEIPEDERDYLPDNIGTLPSSWKVLLIETLGEYGEQDEYYIWEEELLNKDYPKLIPNYSII